MLKGVIVTDPSKMVVARVGVTALAIGQIITDRMVVIALDALDVSFTEQRHDPVRMWTEGAQVAEAEASIHAAPANVAQGRAQGKIVAVNPAKDGDTAKFRCFVRRYSHWCISSRTDSR